MAVLLRYSYLYVSANRNIFWYPSYFLVFLAFFTDFKIGYEYTVLSVPEASELITSFN